MALLACLTMLVMSVAACARTPKALSALRDGRINLDSREPDVRAAAGKPDLILATDGAETFYYRNGDRAVTVTFVGGRVVAFDDGASWPASAAAAADETSDSVATGKVRVGMTEAQLMASMGKADGLTAEDGVETWHWVDSGDVDSVVHVKDGAVIGFSDRPISEYTQNVPDASRSESTTDGRVRVGMSQAEVARIIDEEPERTSGKSGLTTHEYKSNPILGDKIFYSVSYRDGRVVAFSEFNASHDEEQREEAQAKREAANAEARSKSVQRSLLDVLSDPRVAGALRGKQKLKSQTQVSSTTTRSTAKRTLKINGTTYTGGADLGRPCSLEKPCPSDYKCVMVTDRSGMCAQ